MKRGDLIRHQYSGTIYLHTVLGEVRDENYVPWEEGQLGIFLDSKHKDKMLGQGLVRVLVPKGFGFIGEFEIELVRKL